MRQLLLSLFVIAAFLGCKQSQSSPATGTQNPGPSSPTAVTAASPTVSETSPTGPNTASSTSPGQPKVDACALLTTEEIKSIQGEPIRETKLSAQSDGGFSVSQCFFTLPTFTNSISLTVTHQGDGQGARDPKEFWQETFHGERHEVKRKRKKEEAKPEKISSLGDEAFWMGSNVGGALYVLKGNSYMRISVGGGADQKSKIERSTALAQKAISRL